MDITDKVFGYDDMFEGEVEHEKFEDFFSVEDTVDFVDNTIIKGKKTENTILNDIFLESIMMDHNMADSSIKVDEPEDDMFDMESADIELIFKDRF